MLKSPAPSTAESRPAPSKLRAVKERFKRLQHGPARWLVAVIRTIQQTIVNRTPVLIAVDRDGDWWNFRKGGTFVAPELNVASYASAHDLVADRWCYGCTLRPGDVVIDIGAGIGDDALVFSRIVGATGRVIAIEAHPVTYRCLTKTIAANELANVTPLNLAVSDQEGAVFISQQANFLSNSIMDGQSGVKIPAKRLDDILGILRIERPTLIKMNIEGAEIAALDGMQDLMAKGGRIVVSSMILRPNAATENFFGPAPRSGPSSRRTDTGRRSASMIPDARSTGSFTLRNNCFFEGLECLARINAPRAPA